MGFMEGNLKLILMGFGYLYATVHFYFIVIAQVHSIVDSGAQGRFTGVLIHQALTHTNDPDLMPKVCIKHFQR